MRKPRMDSIIATTAAGTDEISLSLGSHGVTFNQDISDAACEITYDRNNKNDKVVLSVPQRAGPLTFSSCEALEEFGEIYAVDTNHKLIAGISVSMVAIIHAEKAFAVSPCGTARRLYHFETLHCREFHDICPPEENFGWLYAVTYILGERDPKGDIAVIVDSDLGNLHRYNNQSAPFYGLYQLPPAVKLIYASADKGGDSPANAAIRQADRDSTVCLRKLEEGFPLQNNRMWSAG